MSEQQHDWLAFSAYLNGEKRTETEVDGVTYTVIVSSRGEITSTRASD